jgi:hypothetical protein
LIQTGEGKKWLGVRRRDRECVQQHACCDHVSNQ